MGGICHEFGTRREPAKERREPAKERREPDLDRQALIGRP